MEDLRKYNPEGSKLREIQHIECDMLRRLIEVCEKHKLKVWVYGGTMLGAVRHHGFIPWDDDIDVFMLREEYDKLLQLAPQEFEFPFFFQSAYTDVDYSFSHAQVRKTDTTAVLPYTLRQRYNQGIFIDIFVFDAVPNNMRYRHRLLTKIHWANKLKYHRFFWYTARNIFTRTIAYIYHLFASCLSHRRVYSKIEQLLRNASKYPHTHVANVFFEDYKCKRSLFALDDLKETVWIPFEDIKVPIPSSYDRLLRLQYDYMTPRHVPTSHGEEIIFDTKKPYEEYIVSKRNMHI